MVLCVQQTIKDQLRNEIELLIDFVGLEWMPFYCEI